MSAQSRNLAQKVRVAAAQTAMRPVASFEQFAEQCRFFVASAAAFRSDFVLFPELLTNPLQALVQAGSPPLTARRLSEFTERYVAMFRQLAVEHAVNVVGATHLTVEDGKLYNVAYLFRRDGTIETQHKLHITPSELQFWQVSAGDRVRVFETDAGKLAILICYDVEFPEAARIAAHRGAELLFVPYNTDLRSGYLRVRSCAQARCIENHFYAVLAGPVGNLPGVEGADVHWGQACVLTPSDVGFARDAIAEEATPNVETLIVQDLDLTLLRSTRASGAVRPWFDRRTDLYRVRFRGEQGDEDV
jgi:predicted amidohydrolase